MAAVPPFKAIYEQYFDFVWSSARRLGVSSEAIDDVVQEVFIVIHSRLDTLQRPEALRSWIYGIVRRTASVHRRATRGHDGTLGAGLPVELQESREPSPADLTERANDLELLTRLLAELDEAKREVFVLVELDEFTVPEVAAALEIPLNTAYSRLRAARQAFEAALARYSASSEGKSRSWRS